MTYDPTSRFNLPAGSNPTFLRVGNVDVAVGRNNVTHGTNELFLGINMHWNLASPGEAWTAIDADDLRDAIDKAVGKREEEVDWRDSDRVEVDGIEGIEGRIVVGRETVGERAGRWAFPSGFHYGDDAVASLNPKAVPAPTPKPYRPVDRDRLLRHTEDLQATLTRRNERHEQDQKRIRELEAEVFTLREIKDSYEEPKTPREYLDLAWERAVAPKDGMIRRGEEAMVMVHGRGDGPGVVIRGGDTPSRPGGGVEYRLLEPRAEVEPRTREEEIRALEEVPEGAVAHLEAPAYNADTSAGQARGRVIRVDREDTGFRFAYKEGHPNGYVRVDHVLELGLTAKDFTPDAYRKDLEAKGLSGWEIELLVNGAR